MTLSIIIPCFNAEKYISRCLDSILASKLVNFEVIVVDDGSTDKSRKVLRNYENSSQVKVFSFKENRGPAQARNFGAAQALGKYLVFLDIDTEIEKGSLKKIIGRFERDKTIGALQTKIMMGRGKNIETAGHFLSPIGFPYEIGVGENEEKWNKEKEILGARGAGMAVRKDVFKKIGGFDEDYMIYGEETDLCWRTWLAGFKVIYFPKAKVYHFGKSTLKKETVYRIFYEGAKNNTGNILKNASFGMLLWVLPLHILGWILLSIKLILQGKLRQTRWIYQGLGWNLKNLEKNLKKRKQVSFNTIKNNRCIQIIFGNINFITILRKGWNWLKHI